MDNEKKVDILPDGEDQDFKLKCKLCRANYSLVNCV